VGPFFNGDHCDADLTPRTRRGGDDAETTRATWWTPDADRGCGRLTAGWHGRATPGRWSREASLGMLSAARRPQRESSWSLTCWRYASSVTSTMASTR